MRTSSDFVDLFAAFGAAGVDFRPFAQVQPSSYVHRMGKQAISVTLDRENLTWLRGQAKARGSRSLSAALDDVIRSARGRKQPLASVKGLVQIAEHDPDLATADAEVRALFTASLGRRPRRPRG